MDEFGRMNGSASNYHYESLPPAPRPAMRSRSPRPMRSTNSVRRSAFVAVRSSAFGNGVFIADHSDFQAAYHSIARRIRVIASGSAFYIGITENPANRWASCHARRYDFMEILAEAPTSRTTSALERQLLLNFGAEFLCENISGGGETASGGSPHFCYVVVRRNGLLRRRR